jgi:acetyltransferase-like isoleucine patch superfamily enzyme
VKGRIRRFLAQPLSRKLQYFSWLISRWKTQWIYRWRLLSCGPRSVVGSPLFWTPEYVALGEDVVIWPGFRIEGVDIDGLPPPRIVLGDGVTVQQNLHLTAGGELTVGAGTTILFDVLITDIDHCYEKVGTRVIDQPMKVTATSIGRNCFVGSGARILAGTILGESCVVGANAVVSGEFPAGCVIAGIPGRIVKRYVPSSAVWVKAEVP